MSGIARLRGTQAAHSSDRARLRTHGMPRLFQFTKGWVHRDTLL